MDRYPRMLFQMKESTNYEELANLMEAASHNFADGVLAFNKDEMRILFFDDDGLLIFDSDE